MIDIDSRRIFNLLNIFAISAVLLFAFWIQIFWHEEPCPLCNLQRLAWIGVAMGIFLNLRFGISSRHYSIAMLAALIGTLIAMRQITLHIIPGQPAYGSAFLGFHLYIWSFFGFVATLFYLALLMFLGERKDDLEVRKI